MKRVKLYSIAMLLILVVSAVVSPTLARAKAEISKEKATMEVDSLLTLRVSGFEDEVSWESDDETVAAVDDSGTVTAMSEGSATITATVFGSEYTCHVTVVDSNKELVQAGESKSDKGIEYVAYETEQGLVVLLENQNDDEIGQVRITIAYYGESGEMLSTDYTFLSEMEPGRKTAIEFDYPVDEEYEPVEFERFELSFRLDSGFSFRKSIADQIGITSNAGSDADVVMKVSNNSEYNASRIEVAVVFVKDGKVVGFDYDYVYSLEPGESEYLTAYAPYDRNWDDIQYDSYEVFINEAYTSDYE